MFENAKRTISAGIMSRASVTAYLLKKKMEQRKRSRPRLTWLHSAFKWKNFARVREGFFDYSSFPREENNSGMQTLRTRGEKQINIHFNLKKKNCYVMLQRQLSPVNKRYVTDDDLVRPIASGYHLRSFLVPKENIKRKLKHLTPTSALLRIELKRIRESGYIRTLVAK